MNHTISYILIETLVRKTLREIKDSPERSTRNLVDMALHFSEGRFQKHFLETAQEMLQNENSKYYRLIPDLAASVDSDRIVTFGMNLGYNSCTTGADTIRSIEAKKPFNIPWAVILEADGQTFPEQSDGYHSVINQGMDLGIFCWQIFSLGQLQNLLELADAHPDCAFVFFCDPEEITESLLAEAADIKNILFVVRYDETASRACRLLRRNRFLYSVYIRYDESYLDSILNGEQFCCAETLHPVLTMLLAAPSCSHQTRQTVYDHVIQERKNQQYQTVPWDIINDNRFIDGIISDDVCSAFFNRDGNLCFSRTAADCSAPNTLEPSDLNLFSMPLEDIFRISFPKKIRD